MQFQINRDVLLKSLSIAHNIIERKNTLPILSNVLLEIKKDKLNIVATDLDILFLDEITDFKFNKEGSTTTSATVLFDILKKLPQNTEISFSLQNENKLNISAENSKFQRQDVHENTKNSTFVNPPLQPFLGMYSNGPKKLYCSDDKSEPPRSARGD